MVDAATVNDFLYDQPVNVATPPVLATNVLGRLAKATFAHRCGVLQLRRPGSGQHEDLHRYHHHAGRRCTWRNTRTTATARCRRWICCCPIPASRTSTSTIATTRRVERVRSSTPTERLTKTVFSAAGSADIDPLGRIRQAQFGLATYTASYADTGRRLLKSVKVTSPTLGSSREISYPGHSRRL